MIHGLEWFQQLMLIQYQWVEELLNQMVHMLIQLVLILMLVIGKLMLRSNLLLKETIGQIPNGHHHNQTLMVTLKKFLFQIQLHTNLEQIHLLTLVIEELLFMLKLNLKVTIGQIQNGLHHNQTLLETLKKYLFQIQLLINQELIHLLTLEIEELLSMLKMKNDQDGKVKFKWRKTHQKKEMEIKKKKRKMRRKKRKNGQLQKKFKFLIQLHIKQLLMLQEELHFILKEQDMKVITAFLETINQNELGYSIYLRNL